MAFITMVIRTRYFYPFLYFDRWGYTILSVSTIPSPAIFGIREIMKTICDILIMYLIKYSWIWYWNLSNK